MFNCLLTVVPSSGYCYYSSNSNGYYYCYNLTYLWVRSLKLTIHDFLMWINSNSKLISNYVISRCCLFLLGPLFFLRQNTFNLCDFTIFDFQRTWWRLFQKRVMRTKLDIYSFIIFFKSTEKKKTPQHFQYAKMLTLTRGKHGSNSHIMFIITSHFIDSPYGPHF